MRLLVALVALLLLGGCVPLRLAPASVRTEVNAPRDLVVLVHGMGRTPLSLWSLERALERAGYRVLNYGYSSYGPSVAQIGAGLDGALDEALAGEPAGCVHFVGHSLGNVVVRWLLANERPGNLGRVVMLAPPNAGSRTADRLTPWAGWLLRPMRELRTANSTVATMPPPVGVAFGVIAGDRDGKVTVAETHLAGAAAHVVVRSGHTFIMQRPHVIRLVGCFLGTGAFEGCDESSGA